MGYSPWGCKESDTTEHISSSVLGLQIRKKVVRTIVACDFADFFFLAAVLMKHSRE